MEPLIFRNAARFCIASPRRRCDNHRPMRKTKIICTLGPATESAEMLREMVEAGANIFRLNMSHATHEWVRVIVPRIRAVAKELDTVVGILMDTQGPAIRTGDLP